MPSATPLTPPAGDLAIVLHTHMPYVLGFGTWPFGEEWLWLAVAESYARLEDEVAGHPVTIGVTPVLADQFEAMRGPAGDRMLAFLGDSREGVFAEEMRSFHAVGRGDLCSSLEPQIGDYRRAAARFTEVDRDFNSLFAALGSSGCELLAGPATHAVMPLLATGFGADLQIETGLGSHRARFGGAAAGVWLPECAQDEWVAGALARAGVTHCCVERTAEVGVGALANLEPVALEAGPVALPLDRQAINLVWSAGGYPAAPAYRSTFNRTIHGLMPYRNDGGDYDVPAARAQAREHAEGFLSSVRARLDDYRDARGRPGLCVFAVDTELLGHWWYEGPWWLGEVCRAAAGAGVRLVTLGEAAVERAPGVGEISPSTWGERNDLSTWDSPAVAEYAWEQRRAELELFDLLGHAAPAPPPAHAPPALPAHAPPASASPAQLAPPAQPAPALLAAARELLALQASDWAFLAARQTAGDYPARRLAGHRAAFTAAVSTAAGALRQSPGPAAGAESNKHDDGARNEPVARIAPMLGAERLTEIRCRY